MKPNYDRMVADMLTSTPQSKSIVAAVLVALVVISVAAYSVLDLLYG